MPNSCRNRYCPKCQTITKEKWLINRQSEVLPATYYHLIFTLEAMMQRLTGINIKACPKCIKGRLARLFKLLPEYGDYILPPKKEAAWNTSCRTITSGTIVFLTAGGMSRKYFSNEI